MGYELLEPADWKDGRRLDVSVYGNENPRIQADAPAQSVDNDYGQFSIMPMVNKPEFNEDKRASWFAHKGETAKAYYYKVYLAEYDIVTELTPTERAAMFRFTFPEMNIPT